MKEIYCTKCGDVINQGYETNPETSEICETCANDVEV